VVAPRPVVVVVVVTPVDVGREEGAGVPEHAVPATARAVPATPTTTARVTPFRLVLSGTGRCMASPFCP
jgi:hypothetical protein